MGYACTGIMYVLLFSVLLTRYLAETGENSSLAGIIAISTIWDGVESINGLERFPNRQLYSHPLSNAIRERTRMSVVLFLLTNHKLTYCVSL